MRKIKLIISAAAMLGLVSSSVVHADGFAPGEGLYLGAFVGGGTGIVQPKVTTSQSNTASATAVDSNKGGVFEATDGGLGLAGFEGGGLVGYGYKMGDLYAGIEGEIAFGDVKFRLTSSTDVIVSGDRQCGGSCTGSTVSFKTIEATKDWTGGMFGRLGYYVNTNTLLAVRGGVLVSKFDVKATGSSDYSEEFYGGGPSFGASLESNITAIDPNLSVRLGAVYTDFLTANVSGLGNLSKPAGQASEVTGSALSARIGFQYSFFDVNALF